MIKLLVILIAGLALILFGSDFLVDGASAIARRLKISEFVIGLTIVGFGTSCPELVVSLNGAFDGLSDVSIGNVIGSNVFNILIILALTAIISPIDISKVNRRADIPLVIGVSILFDLICIFTGQISRLTGVVFLLLFAAYMVFCFKQPQESAEQADGEKMKLLPAIGLTLAGLAGLVIGGKMFVNSAVEIARALNVSEKFIAITLLAGGTSLPELATCITAAIKKKNSLALGNILGSNVFNILLILGCSSLVCPLQAAGMTWADYSALALSSILVFTSVFTGRNNRIDRFDAAVMLCVEAAYLIFLFRGL